MDSSMSLSSLQVLELIYESNLQELELIYSESLSNLKVLENLIKYACLSCKCWDSSMSLSNLQVLGLIYEPVEPASAGTRLRACLAYKCWDSSQGLPILQML
jgi:hypothetical protein